MIEISLNDDILFKPTELGIKYLCDYENKLIQLSGRLKLKTIDDYKKKLDENGYYQLHIWEFIGIFGNVSYMGADEYYEMKVFIKKTTI